jgi:hypothetical protein
MAERAKIAGKNFRENQIPNKKTWNAISISVLWLSSFEFILIALRSLLAAHNAACLASESLAPAIDCLAG